MTDPQVTIRPGFWGELLTAPRIITFATCLFAGGMYVKSLEAQLSDLRTRIDRIEVQLKTDYPRSDLLGRDLQMIREEQTRLRMEQEKARELQTKMAEQMQGLRRDLR